MENPIKLVYKFNQQAGLLNKGYDDFLESSFQIEEALEGFEHLSTLAEVLGVDTTLPKLPRELARKIVNLAKNTQNNISDVDRLDKACDAIVFALGSIFKLGLTPAQATQALNAVMKANMAKLSMPKDEHGKLMKPVDFVGPEEALQAILDKR